MAQNKKRPKYVKEYVNDVNNALEKWGIKDETNDLFLFACSYLMKHKMYEGFNFYKHAAINGKEMLALAGSSNKDKFDCLQLY
jgi:hypothetical protein